jgi:hypothetical protein
VWSGDGGLRGGGGQKENWGRKKVGERMGYMEKKERGEKEQGGKAVKYEWNHKTKKIIDKKRTKVIVSAYPL